jgi:inorganic pyrophosphatase
MAKTAIPQSPFDKLSAEGTSDGLVQVVIETPRGSRNKYKYDEERHLFRLNSVLPAGSSFPYDFGYIPGTKAGDGDPLDVLVLMDQPAFTGCLIEVRIIGVLEAEQTENGKTVRNDRIVAVAQNAHDYSNLHNLKDLEENLLKELEYFFISYNKQRGKEFRLLAAKGPRAGHKCVAEAILQTSAK